MGNRQPPPHGNFEKTPVVYHGPYEYSSPLVEEDWLGADEETARTNDGLGSFAGNRDSNEE